MDQYLLTLMVTFEQEYAIQKLFGRHCWEYTKIIDEKSKNEAESNDRRPLEVTRTPVNNMYPSKTNVVAILAHGKNSDNDVQTGVEQETRRGIKIELDNIEEDNGNDDYGGDTDTEQIFDDLSIIVKQEIHSENDGESDETTADSVRLNSSEAVMTMKTKRKIGNRGAKAKLKTVHQSKRRKGVTRTLSIAEAEMKKDAEECDIKQDSFDTLNSDEPVTLLETLPTIQHVSEIVSRSTHDVESFLTRPEDVDNSGYSATLSAYYCTDCSYTFPEEKYYTQHKHNGKCVFSCQICDERFTFRNFSTYQEHLKQHRYILRSKRKAPDQGDNSISPSTSETAYERYRKRLKNDKDVYATYTKKDSERHRKYRKSLTGDKKKEYNEKSRLRMRKYRENRNRHGIVLNQKSGTRMEIEKKREYWRKQKQEQRTKSTFEQRQKENSQRRQRYKNAKLNLNFEIEIC